jgi:hypothetical protein
MNESLSMGTYACGVPEVVSKSKSQNLMIYSNEKEILFIVMIVKYFAFLLETEHDDDILGDTFLLPFASFPLLLFSYVISLRIPWVLCISTAAGIISLVLHLQPFHEQVLMLLGPPYLKFYKLSP